MTPMERTTYQEELALLIPQLNDEALHQALVYIRALKSRPPGITGVEAIRRARELNWDKDALAEMAEALEELESKIDPDPEVNFD